MSIHNGSVAAFLYSFALKVLQFQLIWTTLVNNYLPLDFWHQAFTFSYSSKRDIISRATHRTAYEEDPLVQFERRGVKWK